jgi:hypothetical protein
MTLERDDLQDRIMDLEEMVRRLAAQVAGHNALLTRMCHGPLSDLPRAGEFPLSLSGPRWSMCYMNSATDPQQAYYWLAWRGPRASEEAGYRNGTTYSPTAAMDAIRMALFELGEAI